MIDYLGGMKQCESLNHYDHFIHFCGDIDAHNQYLCFIILTFVSGGGFRVVYSSAGRRHASGCPISQLRCPFSTPRGFAASFPLLLRIANLGSLYSGTATCSVLPCPKNTPLGMAWEVLLLDFFLQDPVFDPEATVSFG